MKRFIFLLLGIFSFLDATVIQQGAFYKQKQELILLKKELNEFYNKKELSYQKQKQELEDILAKIQADKKAIEDIQKATNKVQKEISREIVSRTIQIYDKMKLKNVLSIFKQKIKDGKFNEVFDIMVRLKQKRFLKILKKMDVPTKIAIVDRMSTYEFETKEEKELNMKKIMKYLSK
jgi:flagellar motility protein MotE (MotC chaperone)